ncbi:hypothetical protein [Oricola sp.]|uniref:hypothetical protein n=1 Tax=Oricola sp. TaxID=1979950 RepID=UPI0035150449
MSARKHRLNRILGWCAAGSAATYFGILVVALVGRLVGASMSGLGSFPGVIGFLSFLLLIVSAPLWLLSWLAGWGKSPEGRFSRAARQGVRTGGTVLWTGLGLAGCVLAVLIAIRLIAAPSRGDEAALAAGLGLFAGLFGVQAFRVGFSLNRDPRRAGDIARTTSRALQSLAIAVIAVSPVVSVVWTIWTIVGLGEGRGWAVLTSALTLVYPIIAGAVVAAVIWVVALAFAYVGRRH